MPQQRLCLHSSIHPCAMQHGRVPMSRTGTVGWVKRSETHRVRYPWHDDGFRCALPILRKGSSIPPSRVWKFDGSAGVGIMKLVRGVLAAVLLLGGMGTGQAT